MNLFIRQHFDKLLMTFLFASLLAAFIALRIDGIFQLLRDVTVAIITLAGARRLQEALQPQTNVEKTDSVNITAEKEKAE